MRKTTVFFPIKLTKIILEKIIKNQLEKYYSNPQCFVRKTITLSPYDLTLF
jgi:hypothetical protein